MKIFLYILGFFAVPTACGWLYKWVIAFPSDGGLIGETIDEDRFIAAVFAGAFIYNAVAIILLLLKRKRAAHIS